MASERGDSVFVKVFGPSPKIRILDFLLTGRRFDYNISDIAEGANLNRITVVKLIKELIKEHSALKTRVMGKSSMYMINMDSNKTKLLFELYKRVLAEIK